MLFKLFLFTTESFTNCKVPPSFFHWKKTFYNIHRKASFLQKMQDKRSEKCCLLWVANISTFFLRNMQLNGCKFFLNFLVWFCFLYSNYWWSICSNSLVGICMINIIAPWFNVHYVHHAIRVSFFFVLFGIVACS